MDANSGQLRVFLCHSSKDKPAVRELYGKLSASGFKPWLDEEDLLPGQEWANEIQKAVRASDVVLVCLSRDSITKQGYVQKEIKFALDVADQQPEGTIFVIPVKLEECEVPNRLSRWHWVNLHEDRGYDKLVKSLEHRNAGMGRPPGNATLVSSTPDRDIRILFMSADPSDATRLRLDDEVRKIRQELRLAAGRFADGVDEVRSRFVLEVRPAIRPQDITREILDVRPRMVHFSGHGSKEGIYLQNDSGLLHQVDGETLAALFNLVSDQVDCVLLSACYSGGQAPKIARSIKYVIGMKKAVKDEAAIAFSVGFYQALGAGKSIPEAFKFGLVQMRLMGVLEDLMPIFIDNHSAGIAPSSGKRASINSTSAAHVIRDASVPAPPGVKGGRNREPHTVDVSRAEIFTFETVTLDETGEVASRRTGQARQLVQELAPGVALEMVAIPGGEFIMGAPKEEAGSSDHERPQHKVTLSRFHMARYVVTQAQWRAIAGLPKARLDLNPDPSHFKGDRLPVEGVSWE
ncbi:MAG TPA: TIR domain-containing protein, partial [Blastocatellia bacterium]|nr:TIR domain-containing protein [Blastocatellia bacterium]